MRNITLSADELLIEQARQKARAKKTTLNEEFRNWLQSYARPGGAELVRAHEELMNRLNYAGSGGHQFSRDERNER